MAAILLVEDEDDLRQLLGVLLGRAGHAVHEARNGDEALETLSQSGCDLIVTDIFMPDKEGIETIREVRRRWPDLKILAISGGGSKLPGSYLDAARRFGADETLAKPFANAQFLEVVDRLLAG